MLLYISCYIYATGRGKEVGDLTSSYEGKLERGVEVWATKSKWWELEGGQILLWIWPLSYSVRTNYLLQPLLVQKEFNDVHYITFLLLSNLISGRQLGKNHFESVFLLRSSFTLQSLFFINLHMTTEWEFRFLNAAIIIFCLICSFNIPHGDQNPSYFPVKRSVFMSSKFTFWRHFDHTILTFLFVWSYHCHERRNYKLHSLFIVSRLST